MTRQLRIARIIARLNVGGPARHVTWLTEALQNEEFASVLITGIVPPGEDDMSGFAAAHGVVPHVIPEMSREISPRDVVTIWKLFRFFRRFRPDVVHTHTAKAGAAGRVAGVLYRFLTPGTLIGRPQLVRFVHTFHGHVFHSYYGRAKTQLFITIEKILARFTDAIIVLSAQQLEEIHTRFRVGRRGQFRIVPLGLDLAALAGGTSLRESLGIPSSETIVGYVGRLTAIKNHDLFLDVATRVQRPGVRFVIFGDGAERSRLETAARGSVVFAGTQEAAAIYASLDIAALTSLNEGTPLTLIEAMTAGRPVISTAVGGVVDVLGPTTEVHAEGSVRYEIRERGISVASGDAASFSAGLVRLLDDRGLRERLAAAGRNYVTAEYSKDRLTTDIMRLYRELSR